MPLIASISGIRGTIGGIPRENLTPEDIIGFCNAFGKYLKSESASGLRVVIGRDARPSGLMVSKIVSGAMMQMGFDVIDLGLATTPTTELAVRELQASGGIIITASHNPVEWNAMKLLGPGGEFLDAEAGSRIIEILEQDTEYPVVRELGTYSTDDSWLGKHIKRILSLDLVDPEAIANAGFRIAVDAVNSVGGFAVSELLDALGIRDVNVLNGNANGWFAHDPEPLPKNLVELSKACRDGADLGIAVDPDVDRLALVCEDGSFFGEEYTLVAVADYVLQHTPGNTVSNLSSTRALQEVTEKYGGVRFTSAVGEVNVVEKMKEVDAVIGGEGNGGVIYPKMHFGRDALTGIALFLSQLAKAGLKASELRGQYPEKHITKQKIALGKEVNPEEVLNALLERLAGMKMDQRDGLWIDLGNDWVHLRKSNTEPIIRIYAESDSEKASEELAEQYRHKIMEVIGE